METEAIVLNCSDYGESDIIVTLYCQEQGRITAIAKGAKKSLRRFVNKLELFSFLHVVCTRTAGRPMAFLAEADLHTSFINIRTDLARYTIASVIREFLLIAIKEEEADDRIFQLCLWALHNIDRMQQPKATLALFLIRFYDYLGYRPDLESCGKCAKQVTSRLKSSFDPGRGRIICAHCIGPSEKGMTLSQGAIHGLRSAQQLPLERLHRLKLSGTILNEALAMLHSYGKHLLQRDIISWKMLQAYPFIG